MKSESSSATSTRLSRNCSDWYPLLDLCAMNQCLIGDRDGGMTPTSNRQTPLGMRNRLGAGTPYSARTSERGHVQQGQAWRAGDATPLGYIRLDDGAVVKDPDLQVQESIALVFRLFLELRRAGKVARHMQEHGLLLPRAGRVSRMCILRPQRRGTVLRILRNPTYTGAYVFGRSRWVLRTDAKRPKYHCRCFPATSGRSSSSSILTATSIGIRLSAFQTIPQSNYSAHQRRNSPGVARDGINLWRVLYCGHCGRQMTVCYSGTGTIAAAACAEAR